MTVIRSGARALVHSPHISYNIRTTDPRWSATWRGQRADQVGEKKIIKTIDTDARDRTIYTKAVNFGNSKREVKKIMCKMVKDKGGLMVQKGVPGNVIKIAYKKLNELDNVPDMAIVLHNAPKNYRRVKLARQYRILSEDYGESWALYDHDEYEKRLKVLGLYHR